MAAKGNYSSFVTAWWWIPRNFPLTSYKSLNKRNVALHWVLSCLALFRSQWLSEGWGKKFFRCQPKRKVEISDGADGCREKIRFSLWIISFSAVRSYHAMVSIFIGHGGKVFNCQTKHFMNWRRWRRVKITFFILICNELVKIYLRKTYYIHLLLFI